MNEKLFIPLNATKSAGTNTTSPTERPNKSIELGKWIKRFFGISPQGDSNLTLNQQGDWVTVSGALGYTPENVANKATSLISPDNTKYPTTQAVQTALDLKADISNVSIVLYKSITQTIVTNKTSETSIYSIPLPTDGSSYIIQLFSNAQIATYPGFTQNQRIRCGTYLAPIDGITGANAIGNQTLIFNNQGTTNGAPIYIDRTYIFKGGASGSIYSVQSGVAEIYNTATPATLMSANFTTQHYLYVCFSPVNSGIIQHNFIVIKTIKI